MEDLWLSKNTKNKLQLSKLLSMSSASWSNLITRIWSNLSASEKMQHIKRKIKLPTTVSPLFWSILVEDSCLISLLILENSQKKLQEPISTKWWMDFIIFIRKDMPTETSSLKIFCYLNCSSSKLLTSASLVN